MKADKDLLEMVFSNFIINAIDAIELDDNEEGSIQIEYIKNDSINSFHDINCRF